MEGKDEPLEFKRVLDNIRVRINDILFQVKRLMHVGRGKIMQSVDSVFDSEFKSFFFIMSAKSYRYLSHQNRTTGT